MVAKGAARLRVAKGAFDSPPRGCSKLPLNGIDTMCQDKTRQDLLKTTEKQ
jgi:hypothetical protein